MLHAILQLQHFQIGTISLVNGLPGLEVLVLRDGWRLDLFLGLGKGLLFGHCLGQGFWLVHLEVLLLQVLDMKLEESKKLDVAWFLTALVGLRKPRHVSCLLQHLFEPTASMSCAERDLFLLVSSS